MCGGGLCARWPGGEEEIMVEACGRWCCAIGLLFVWADRKNFGLCRAPTCSAREHCFPCKLVRAGAEYRRDATAPRRRPRSLRGEGADGDETRITRPSDRRRIGLADEALDAGSGREACRWR